MALEKQKPIPYLGYLPCSSTPYVYSLHLYVYKYKKLSSLFALHMKKKPKTSYCLGFEESVHITGRQESQKWKIKIKLQYGLSGHNGG